MVSSSSDSSTSEDDTQLNETQRAARKRCKAEEEKARNQSVTTAGEQQFIILRSRRLPYPIKILMINRPRLAKGCLGNGIFTVFTGTFNIVTGIVPKLPRQPNPEMTTRTTTTSQTACYYHFRSNTRLQCNFSSNTRPNP